MQKTNQKEFRIEKVIKRKGNKLYAKSKGYNNSFNCWIDEKYILYENELFFRNTQHKNNIKVALDLPNYPTKSDLKKRNKNWYITVS